MQFVLLVRVDPDLPVPEGADVGPWVEEGERSGMRLAGGPAEAPEHATTVRVRGGVTEVTPGPVGTAQEFVAGYDLVEADSAEAAADYATRHPVADFGAIEVREVWADFVDGEQQPPEPVEEGVDYLFLHVPDLTRLAEVDPALMDPTAWVREVERRRLTLGGYRLRDEQEASTVVRRRGGEVLATRGPFAELAEQIAGIDRMRFADLDEAIEFAAKHPTAQLGAIEIRPLLAG